MVSDFEGPVPVAGFGSALYVLWLPITALETVWVLLDPQVETIAVWMIYKVSNELVSWLGMGVVRITYLAQISAYSPRRRQYLHADGHGKYT